AGLLQAKFEALKRKLEAQGLFDPAQKRPLPKFPKRIGIVTSPSGAAIRDMLNVLQRRAPGVQILISPVRVQGTGAASEIAVAIRELATPNDKWPPLDLIVVTRGGGSIEDLWEFNEEIVARAIFDSAVPIVSAVGHEIDFTIADFVADLRAPTPSAAAELIVPDLSELLRRVDELKTCLDRNLRNFISHAQTRLRFLSEKALGREPLQRLRGAQQRIDLARESLGRSAVRMLSDRQHMLARFTGAVQARSPERELSARRTSVGQLERRLLTGPARTIDAARRSLETLNNMLRLLSPEATLRRGYSITTDSAGAIVRSRDAVVPRQQIRTRVSDGTFDAQVL
ncbi:MAG TPA: exodeoxyribonuclease VII large subunit, partial [Chthoniobacterales bacterium]